MWKTVSGGVEIPEKVLMAAKEGQLVIFAGAGVSRGEPSNLPNFRCLARQIACGSGERITDDEPVEIYLGRLKSRGTRVHALVKERLRDSHSTPTKLHRDIVTLFEKAGKMRLVTTNFDTHFSTVADDIYGKDNVHTYYAPALPIGRDFEGLIYLHGSVVRRDTDMVLTDEDFGRAYLLDGWASRFLYELFSAFTVVFIGYSHDDTIMHYLSRGLASGPERFAFCRSGAEKDWLSRGITPISFPYDDEHDFSRLEQCISYWTFRLSDNEEERIRAIVNEGPPEDLEETYYLGSLVRRLSTLQVFTTYASDTTWLLWAEKKGLLDRLFDVTSNIFPEDNVLINWIVRCFLPNHTDEVLALLARKRGMHSALWNACVVGVTEELDTLRAKFGHGSLSSWASVFASHSSPGCSIELAEGLLGRCQLPNDATAALILLELITRPRLSIQEPFGFPDFSSTVMDSKVLFSCRNFGLIWGKIFRDHLECCVGQILEIITSQFRLGALWAQATGDVLGSDMVAILSENTCCEEPFDNMVHAAWECIKWLSGNHVDSANVWLTRWMNLDIPLFQRLAICGLTVDSSRSADDKLTVLLDKDFLYKSEIKYEVFELLRLNYPKATVQVRELIIHQQPCVKGISGAAREEADKAKYDLFSLLNTACPACHLVENALAELQNQYPYFDTECPDVLARLMGAVEELSPVSVAELQMLHPGDAVPRVLEWMYEVSYPFTQKMLQETIARAVGVDFEWSLKFAQHLDATTTDGKNLVWSAILVGWEQAKIDARSWRACVQLIKACPAIHGQWSLIRLLRNKTSANSDVMLEEGCLDAVEGLLPLLAEKSIRLAMEEGKFNINIGKGLMSVVRNCLFHRRKLNNSTSMGSLEPYCSVLRMFVDNSSVIANSITAVLAGQYYYLAELDPGWAGENLLPLFVWPNGMIDNAHVKLVKSAWFGHLSWGKSNEKTFTNLRPYYARAIRELNTVKEVAKPLWRQIVNMALGQLDNPLEDEWLPQILLCSTEEQRCLFAQELGQQLSHLDSRKISLIWRRWLNKYWEYRIVGKPVALTSAEAGMMAKWAIALRDVFPEVVSLIMKGPDLDSTSRDILFKVSTSNLPIQFPLETARLLDRVLAGMGFGQFAELRHAMVICSMLPKEVDVGLLARINERLRWFGAGR